MLTLTCRSCGTPITGDTIDELTANVQTHVQRHGHSRPIRHEHIAARLKREQGGQDRPGNSEHQHPSGL